MKYITTIKLPKTPAKLISESDIFLWIDPDFKSYGLSKSTNTSKPTDCSVYELDKDGSFKDIYARFPWGLDDMVMTQGQVLEFVKDNKDLLSDFATFFLLKEGKEGKEFFVAHVRRDVGELGAGVDHFERERVWRALYRCRFVLPQLDSKNLKDDSLTLKSFDPDTTEARLQKIENWIKKEANFINPFD